MKLGLWMLKKLSDTPLFLASILNCNEALRATQAGAHIIDCKDSSQDPLGALSYNAVRNIVKAVGDRVLVSATIGNIIDDEEALFDATCQMTSTGVDFVKVGLFMDGNPLRTMYKLKNLNKKKAQIVGLLFAEENPDQSLLSHMSKCEFSGVMIDTLNKKGHALPDLMSEVQLKEFVKQAHQSNLFVGFAGSLRIKHIEFMISLKMDLIGFRGALCKNEKREDHLDEDAVRAIASKIVFLKRGSFNSRDKRDNTLEFGT